MELPGLTINYISRITEVRGKEVDLTPKEYALLWLLSNSPTSLVKRLREKIEPDVANPYYIRTIHGVGYKLGVKPC